MAEQPTPKRAASAVGGKSPKPRVKRPSAKADSAPELPAPYAPASVMAAVPALEATVRPAGETTAKPDHPPLPGPVVASAVPPASEMARRIAEYEALRIEREKAEKTAREAARIAHEAQKAAKLTEAVAKVIRNCRVEWEKKLCDPQKWIIGNKAVAVKLEIRWLANGGSNDEHDYNRGLCCDFVMSQTTTEMLRQLQLLYPSYDITISHDTAAYANGPTYPANRFIVKSYVRAKINLEINSITD